MDNFQFLVDHTHKIIQIDSKMLYFILLYLHYMLQEAFPIEW